MAPLHNYHTGIQNINSHNAKQFDIKYIYIYIHPQREGNNHKCHHINTKTDRPYGLIHPCTTDQNRQNQLWVMGNSECTAQTIHVRQIRIGRINFGLWVTANVRRKLTLWNAVLLQINVMEAEGSNRGRFTSHHRFMMLSRECLSALWGNTFNVATNASCDTYHSCLYPNSIQC